VAEKIPDLRITGEESGDLLVVGWGGSRGYLYYSRQGITV